jgi:hypothetical protein
MVYVKYGRIVLWCYGRVEDWKIGRKIDCLNGIIKEWWYGIMV